MWNSNRLLYKIKIASLALFLSLFLFCASPVLATSTSESASPQTIVISIDQYNNFKSRSIKLEMILDQLEAKLAILEQDSSVQAQELIACQDELAICKQELKLTNERLANAEISLEKADELLLKSEQTTTQLTKQIESLKKHYRTSMLQNVVKSLAAGFVIGYAMSK